EKAVNDEKRKFKLKQQYGLEYGYDENNFDEGENYDDAESPLLKVGQGGLSNLMLSGETPQSPGGFAAPYFQKGALESGNPEPTECLIDIAVDAYIPNRYVESELLRIEIYKRIAAVENKDDADDLKDELTDRFGEIPKPVENLIDIALIRNSACIEYIDSIENKDKKSIIIYAGILSKPYGQKTLEKWTIAASKMNGRLLLSMGQKPHVAYFLKDGENIIGCLKEIMSVLAEIKI
ncbi:MAG: hypothetical protein FWD23_17050, partial [Oscillospiraceae bacterium]|nr:hypothetical protein [Oscillospiraceae bacterium]